MSYRRSGEGIVYLVLRHDRMSVSKAVKGYRAGTRTSISACIPYAVMVLLPHDMTFRSFGYHLSSYEA